MAETYRSRWRRLRIALQHKREVPMRLNLLEDECLMTFKASLGGNTRVLDKIRGVGACHSCGSRELCLPDCPWAPWNQEEEVDKKPGQE